MKYSTWKNRKIYEKISLYPTNAIADCGEIKAIYPLAIRAERSAKYERKHIFVETEELSNMFFNMGISNNNLSTIQDCVCEFVYNLTSDQKITTVELHLPNKYDSIVILAMKGNSGKSISAEIPLHGKYKKIHGERLYMSYTLTISEKNLSRINKELPVLDKYTTKEDIRAWEVARRYEIYILNMFLYLSSFPESLNDGPPEKYFSKDGSLTIKETPRIFGNSGCCKSAHLRSGHFRVLRSERYKNKRFQTIYVKPTMVKGHAKTVIGIEQDIEC